MGIIGFIAFVGLWSITLGRLRRAARLGNPQDYVWVIVVALYYVIWADLMESLFTHSIAQTQRWFDLGLASMVVLYWVRHTNAGRVDWATQERQGES